VKRIFFTGVLALLLAAAPAARAVVIMETTWRAHGGEELHWDRGFEANEALAAQPQFAAMVSISNDGGKSFGMASGTWIGNTEGRGYILSAAHVFDGESAGSIFVRTSGGAILRGSRVWVHPRWFDSDASEKGGFDIAILRLSGAVTDVRAPATLYGGDRELHARAVIVGYGVHGVAPFGHGWRYGPRAGDRATAAENVIDVVQPMDLASKDGDWGNSLEIDLDQPTPGKNRFGDAAPVSPLEGVLSPGDSGGAIWIHTQGGWRVAGVNSSGDPGAAYQDASQFARVSTLRDWIALVFPGAQFGD
jgi:Trypsin-like peptidase domain